MHVWAMLICIYKVGWATPSARVYRHRMDVSKCLRCGHEWRVRIDTASKQCPGCRSSRWHIPTGRTDAITRVAVAIRKGKLRRLDGTVPCVDCGKPATEYDHRDYAKPLEVEAVCSSCNSKRGPAIGRIDRRSITTKLTKRELKQFQQMALNTGRSAVDLMTEALRRCLEEHFRMRE